MRELLTLILMVSKLFTKEAALRAPQGCARGLSEVCSELEIGAPA